MFMLYAEAMTSSAMQLQIPMVLQVCVSPLPTMHLLVRRLVVYQFDLIIDVYTSTS